MALEESRQQASTGVAASLEALGRDAAAPNWRPPRPPRASRAVETEVSRRLVAAEATVPKLKRREDEHSACCLDRPGIASPVHAVVVPHSARCDGVVPDAAPITGASIFRRRLRA